MTFRYVVIVQVRNAGVCSSHQYLKFSFKMKYTTDAYGILSAWPI